jgi:tRNA modification GTPase
MSVFAAVMTGKGTGAISTVQVFGDLAEAVIAKIFRAAGTKPASFRPGEIRVGVIHDGDKCVDQVTIGCEGDGNFAIGCHGNPLIVAELMELLQRHGVEAQSVEQLAGKILAGQSSNNTIAIEAKLALAKAKTMSGSRIITNQIASGLNSTASRWLDNINGISLEQIRSQAGQILKASLIAKLLIDGCRIVLTGPPNTGKSTLLNCLAGRQKAIVSDIKGTTRDWVSSDCLIGRLFAEVIDTAGLDERLWACSGEIDKVSQEKTSQLLADADLILLVLDNSQPIEQLDKKIFDKLSGEKVITVLNKSDLPPQFESSRFPDVLSDRVSISAKSGEGIQVLAEKIQQVCEVTNFGLNQAVCITSRQEKLVQQLKQARTMAEAASIITELLKGGLGV